MNKEARLKKLARRLLATTCLTAAAAGMASATSFTESTDFPNDPGTTLVLDTGITSIVGSLCPDCGDTEDWFDIPGLAPGVSAHITIVGSPEGFATIGDLGDDGVATIFGPAEFNSEGGSIVTDVTVPVDGNLAFGIVRNPQLGDSVNYTVTLSQTLGTPEPGTFAAGALALAGAVALRRKRKQQA